MQRNATMGMAPNRSGAIYAFAHLPQSVTSFADKIALRCAASYLLGVVKS